MFESFTAGAERALTRAEAVAGRRGATMVEPLDLLAALALEAESRAAELLAEFGVSTARLREAMDARAWDDGRGPRSSEAAEPIPRSAALRLVLSEAMSQARALDRIARGRHRAPAGRADGRIRPGRRAAPLRRPGAPAAARSPDDGHRRGVRPDPDGRGHPAPGPGRGRRWRGPGADPRRLGQPRPRGAPGRRGLRPVRPR